MPMREEEEYADDTTLTTALKADDYFIYMRRHVSQPHNTVARIYSPRYA